MKIDPGVNIHVPWGSKYHMTPVLIMRTAVMCNMVSLNVSFSFTNSRIVSCPHGPSGVYCGIIKMFYYCLQDIVFLNAYQPYIIWPWWFQWYFYFCWTFGPV